MTTTRIVDQENMDATAIEHFRQVAAGYVTAGRAASVLVDSKLPATGGEYFCKAYEHSNMVVVMFQDGRTNRDRTVGNFIIEE